MRKTLLTVAALAAVGLAFVVAGNGGGQTPSAADDARAVRDAVAAYAEAFNKGDLAALGAFWDAEAEYIDEAGQSTKGRDAIVALFKQQLAAAKGSKLALKVTAVRLLKGGAALQDGTSELTGPDGSVNEGRFTAVWSKADGKWLIQNVRDLPYDAAAAPGAAGALKELQWLVGDWHSEKGAAVSVRWVLNKAFLLEEHKIKEADGELTVTQLVGFDPLTGQIKSWTFDSRGGYGEGLWARNGNAWTVEAVGVLSNGQTGSAVNVIRYVDDQTLVFQSRDREVGGQPIPDAEVKLTRKSAK